MLLLVRSSFQFCAGCWVSEWYGGTGVSGTVIAGRWESRVGWWAGWLPEYWFGVLGCAILFSVECPAIRVFTGLIVVLVLFYVGIDAVLWYSWWECVWLAFSNVWVAGGGFVGFCFGEWSFCFRKTIRLVRILDGVYGRGSRLLQRGMRRSCLCCLGDWAMFVGFLFFEILTASVRGLIAYSSTGIRLGLLYLKLRERNELHFSVCYMRLASCQDVWIIWVHLEIFYPLRVISSLVQVFSVYRPFLCWCCGGRFCVWYCVWWCGSWNFDVMMPGSWWLVAVWWFMWWSCLFVGGHGVLRREDIELDYAFPLASLCCRPH